MSTTPKPNPPIPTVADAHRRVLPPPPPLLMPAPPSGAVSRGLAGALRGFLWAAGALAAMSTVMAVSCLVTFNRFYEVRGEATAHRRLLEERWLDQDDALNGTTSLFMTIWIVVFVLLIVWSHKAHAASQRRWTGSRQWSRGWATGAWFVPIANLWIPKSVIGEIEKIVDAPREQDMASPAWKWRPSSDLGWVWWFALLGGFLPFVFSSALSVASDDIDPFRVRAYYTVRLMAFACWATSCVVGVFYVRLITRAANRSTSAELLR